MDDKKVKDDFYYSPSKLEVQKYNKPTLQRKKTSCINEETPTPYRGLN